MMIDKPELSTITSLQNIVFRSRDEQPNEIQTWSSAIPVENVSGLGDSYRHNEMDEENAQPAEARAWSPYQNNPENILNEGPSRKEKILLTSTRYGQQSKDDARGVEQVLSFIDKRRPPRQRKYRVTWRTFIGTMSGLDQIYAREDFLRDFEEFRSPFIFIDSVFRGIGQVMFANSPLSGIIITIGLFIGNRELALYGLLGTCMSTLTAHVLGFNYNSIRAGLYGYNGCLTAMGIAYFSFSHSPQLIGPVVIMSIFSTVFVVAVGKILVQRLELSPYTFSFQICTWIWLLGSLKFRYFFMDGTILSPSLLTTLTNRPQLSNVSFPSYSVQDNFVGFFASIAQVYFIESPYTGAIILVGVCICSRILAFFALFGAVTSQLTAAYMLGLPATAIHAGLWGYNSVLTCQALGGMFFVLYGYRIWLFTLFGSIMTVLLQAAVSAFLSPVGMPTLTFPFTVICWIFCLIAGSKDLIAVKITAVSIPEDHNRRFRLSRLVKSQFTFINHFTNLSSTQDDDITWEELLKIQAEFVPILMCTYIYQNDLDSLKMLVKQKVNIHSTDQNLRSPLHVSASQGNMKICKWLVGDLKVNVNSVDRFGGTPLYDALWNGHFHLLPYLYSHGARLPACKSKELAFYLNAFVYERNVEAIELFLSCGFNPNTSDYDGQNALHLAVITNCFDIVCYLVEETRVWLDQVDYSRQTAIQYALRLPDLTIANYLLYKRDNNHNPLLIPVEKSIPITIIEEHKVEEEEKKAFSASMDENILPTLFCMIAAQEDTKKMANFLEQYPHLNAFECVNYDFRSAAHVAAAGGQLESIRFLSKYSDSFQFNQVMNREDRWGLSPLDEAYRHGHFHICDFVKEHTLSQDNDKYKKVSHSIEIDIDTNTVVRLLRKWHKIFLFSTLSASGAAERIEGLFARGYFLRTELYVDYHGRTPMHFAAMNGHLNVIQMLIRNGYNCATHKDRWGNYPIDEARRNQFDKIVDELEQFDQRQNILEI